MIVYGQSMYGKVDEVEGMFWVSTQFAHIYWVPLIPMGSYIVTGEDGDGIQGLKIPLYGKSVGVAYLQGLCLVAILGGLIAGIASGQVAAWAVFGVGIVAMIGIMMAPGLRKADWNRAQQLAKQIGLVEEGWVILGMMYGKIDERTAERQLHDLASQREQEHIEREVRREEARAERAERRAEKKARSEEKRERNRERNDDLRAKAPKKRKSRLRERE